MILLNISEREREREREREIEGGVSSVDLLFSADTVVSV